MNEILKIVVPSLLSGIVGYYIHSLKIKKDFKRAADIEALKNVLLNYPEKKSCFLNINPQMNMSVSEKFSQNALLMLCDFIDDHNEEKLMYFHNECLERAFRKLLDSYRKFYQMLSDNTVGVPNHRDRLMIRHRDSQDSYGQNEFYSICSELDQLGEVVRSDFTQLNFLAKKTLII